MVHFGVGCESVMVPNVEPVIHDGTSTPLRASINTPSALTRPGTADTTETTASASRFCRCFVKNHTLWPCHLQHS